MSRLIKKHRRQLFGIGLPVFFLFVIGAIGMSVFPGWVRPSYGTLGAQCTTISSNSADPLLTACNPCLLEICSSGTCAYNSLNSGSSFDLQCAGCFCSPTVESIGSGQFMNLPQCNSTANDSFCQNIAGGDVTNDCRTGVCAATTFSDFDSSNPTGCDFSFSVANSNVDCVNCAPPTDQSINCGNGICEETSGETFDTCPEDCKVPGFQFDTVLQANQPPLSLACPNLIAISFGGNVTNGGSCEDGDVCTSNECLSNGSCDINPAACSGNAADLCCPSGCNPAPNGTGTCDVQLDPACDVDCLPPQSCEASPSPSPTPTPIPTFTPILPPLDISGNSPFGCALGNAQANAAASLLLMAAAVAGTLWLVRRKKQA